MEEEMVKSIFSSGHDVSLVSKPRPGDLRLGGIRVPVLSEIPDKLLKLNIRNSSTLSSNHDIAETTDLTGQGKSRCHTFQGRLQVYLIPEILKRNIRTLSQSPCRSH